MPSVLRMSKRELVRLIDEIEQSGGDAKDLKKVLEDLRRDKIGQRGSGVVIRRKGQRRRELQSVRENMQRKKILDYAEEQGWVINPSKGMEDYVQNILRFGYCPCDKRRAECPCVEANDEVDVDGFCLCRLYWRDYDAFKATLRAGEKDDEEITP